MEKTAENERKKQYLMNYGNLVRQMKRSELKMEEMRMNKIMPAAVLDGMPHAHGKSDLSGYAAMLDEEERKYVKARYLRIRECREITERIEQLADEDEKDVLMYRYIRLMKWEDICEEMNLSCRRVHYIHNAALEHFIF